MDEREYSYFGDEERDDKVFEAIADSLARIKDREVDEIMLGDDRNVDNIIMKVDEVIADYENDVKLFAAWIYEGKVPDELDEDEDEDEDDETEYEEDSETEEEQDEE